MSALNNLYKKNSDTEVPSYFFSSMLSSMERALKNIGQHAVNASIQGQIPDNDPYKKYRGYLDANDNFIDGPGRNSGAYQGIQKGLAELYYNQRMKELDPSSLRVGKPTEYIQSMEHAYDEYARKVPHVNYVLQHGKDPDGTSADWLNTAKSAADAGMIDYGKFGRAHNRPLPRLVGYYDAAGNMVQPGETPAFQSVLNTKIEDSPYQEFYDPVKYPEMELNPIAQRNLALRNHALRKTPDAEYVDDYVEWLKQDSQKPLMDEFQIGMNLSDLYGTDRDDAMRLAMTSYAADQYKNMGEDSPYNKELPQWRMPQNLVQPERNEEVYKHNMSRLYRTPVARQKREFGLTPNNMLRGLAALYNAMPDYA